MDFLKLMSKAYWHLFKVMPCEMILKKKWSGYNFVSSYADHSIDLSEIKANKDKSSCTNIIWVYWDKGLDSAPNIVRACYRSLLQFKPDGWSVVFLDSNSVRNYLTLPSDIEELVQKDSIYKATYSDFLRTALLYEYGGIWMDSTCLLTSQIPNAVLSEDLFMFRIGDLLPCEPEICESWFIRSGSGNYIMKRLLQDMLFYLRHCKTPKKVYYVWFYLLSHICNNDHRAKELINRMLYWNHMDAILLADKYGLDHEWSEDLWEKISYRCFVHKLTYKYDASIENRNTFLNYIMTASK